mgnify:FL=1
MVPSEEKKSLLEGIDFVFEMGLKQIDMQMRTVESIDLKISILSGFLGLVLVTTAGFVFTAKEGVEMGAILQYPFTLGIILIFIALLNALQSSRTRLFRFPINFEELVKWANEEEKNIKDNFSGDVLGAFRHNQSELKKKTNYFKWSMVFTFLGILFFTIPLIVILVERSLK